jgi:hypothetical protein
MPLDSEYVELFLGYWHRDPELKLKRYTPELFNKTLETRAYRIEPVSTERVRLITSTPHSETPKTHLYFNALGKENATHFLEEDPILAQDIRNALKRAIERLTFDDEDGKKTYLDMMDYKGVFSVGFAVTSEYKAKVVDVEKSAKKKKKKKLGSKKKRALTEEDTDPKPSRKSQRRKSSSSAKGKGKVNL